MSVASDAVEKKVGGQKGRNAWILIVFGLIVAGGLVIYWQYPNFYRYPAAQFYSWAARVSALVGNGKLAYFAADRAVTIDPTNVEYLNKRCWYGSLAGDAARVLGDCQRVVEAWPSSISAHCSLGVALVLVGDYEHAIKEFQFYVDHSDQHHQDGISDLDHGKWIAFMKKGSSPFDGQTMQKLLLH